MTAPMDANPYEDVRSMTCECGKGRIGDGHKGCYQEALFQQKGERTNGR